MISSAGGSAIAFRVDHTVEREVEEVFGRVVRERGRIDILVNSIAGEDPLMAQWCSFWKTDLKNAETALRQSLVSHNITAKHAAPYMIRNRSGLIVEVTENDVLSAGGNPVTQVVKLALKGLALNMAAELRPYVNHVQLIGFLGKDPEKRQVRGNGTSFTVLSVATQQSWKDANDEWQSRTEWHRVVAFNRPGESLADTLHKGDHVLVDGMLVSSKYDRENGKSKKAKAAKVTVFWSVRANSVRRLSRAEAEIPATPSTEGAAESADAPF